MAQDSIAKITGPPQPGFHLGCRFGASFGCFDSGEDCFAQRLLPDTLLQCLREWIERIEHGSVAGFCATHLTDGIANPDGLLLAHWRRPGCPGSLTGQSRNVQEEHAVERS